MSLEELRERIKAEGLYDADYTGESNDHIPDAGEMPWDNEPTPLELERRMRAAERLLESKMCRRECECCKEAKAHLEAARKEDEQ